MSRVGDTLFIAGEFRRVGISTPNAVSLDPATGAVTPLLPQPDASVRAVVSDGAGGWFLGGDFTSIAGVPRQHLAHVLASGRISSWSPDVNGFVSALAWDGRRLYIGGGFTEVGHRVRNHVAAIDGNSGQADRWDPDADVGVSSLALGDHVLYVGGAFSRIGGAARRALAAIDLASGRATTWDPEPEGSDAVYPTNVSRIALSGNKVFVAGQFSSIGGVPRQHLAALDRTTGSAGTWRADISYRGQVSSLVVKDGLLFVGGSLGTIAGLSRGGAAAINAETGEVTPWDPAPEDDVYALAIDGDTVYLGGVFLGSAYDAPVFLEAVNRITGQKRAWNPDPSAPVFVLTTDGNAVIAGGSFTLFHGTRRYGLASIDLTTGRATDWAPHPDNFIGAMTARGSTLYVAGNFTSFSGQERDHFAAFDTRSGLLTTWAPRLDDFRDVRALATSDSTVCVFYDVGGLLGTFEQIAVIDRFSATPRPPFPFYWQGTRCIAVAGSNLLVGYTFPSADFPIYSGFLRVDLSTGEITTLAPFFEDETIDAAVASDGILYFGGRHLDRLSAQVRSELRTIDPITESVVSWKAGADGIFDQLIVDRGTLYAGGNFRHIAGRELPYLAAFDIASGKCVNWDPRLSGPVSALESAPRVVYVGGSFTSLDGLAQTYLGVAEGVHGGPPSERHEKPEKPSGLSVVAGPPGQIRFTLASPAPVSLAIFDVAGRRVASLLDHAALEAGPHSMASDSVRLPSGLYLYRIDAGSDHAGGRLVVLH